MGRRGFRQLRFDLEPHRLGVNQDRMTFDARDEQLVAAFLLHQRAKRRRDLEPALVVDFR